MKLTRNIPAHAGKTVLPRSRATRVTEHPRARGENAQYIHGKQADYGTSPRTRGKRWQKLQD